MQWRTFFVYVFIWWCPAFSVFSADVTDVADSFDYDQKNPFDFRLRLSYQLSVTTATIARERGGRDEQFFDSIPEFDATHTQHKLFIIPKLGLYKDLEFRVSIPIVFSESFLSIPTRAENRGTSLVDDGIVVDQPQSLSRHGPGIGDVSFGLLWGILNHRRDRSFATWVVGMNWTAPTGTIWDPKDPRVSTEEAGLGVGRGVHVLSWNCAFSKRISRFEPYTIFWYDLPIVPESTKTLLQEGLHSESLQERVLERALRPGQSAGLRMGTEILFWEHFRRQQKLALDLYLTGKGRFVGRDFTIFTDRLASYRPANNSKQLRMSLITDHEQMFSFGAGAALHFRMAKYGFFRILGSVSHTLPYFITNAIRGVDENLNGFVDPGTDEEYPYHVRTIDGIGKRLKQLDTLTWQLQIFVALTL